MTTKREDELINRLVKDMKEWICIITNNIKGNFVKTSFTSKNDSIESILHKIRLDLLTNLHFGIIEPITISIIEVKDGK